MQPRRSSNTCATSASPCWRLWVSRCPALNVGYDGVQIYAPYHVYGDHEALQTIRRSRACTGPGRHSRRRLQPSRTGWQLPAAFQSALFQQALSQRWGDPFNTDEDHNAGAREFLIGNACYWIREFHLDGFRLDATQSIFDSSKTHLLAELTTRARAIAQPRSVVFIAENEPQCSEHLLPVNAGGFGMDAMWNDDFHHSVRVALAGSRDGYFRDYTGRAQELLSSIKRGFLYQGQYYYWQSKPRGSPLRGVPRHACVHFLQNHDQVGNTGIGDRVHTYVSPRRYRAATALLLLGPQTPLLFMGQEWAASTPFQYFTDLEPELGRAVTEGRVRSSRRSRSSRAKMRRRKSRIRRRTAPS